MGPEAYLAFLAPRGPIITYITYDHQDAISLARHPLCIWGSLSRALRLDRSTLEFPQNLLTFGSRQDQHSKKANQTSTANMLVLFFLVLLHCFQGSVCLDSKRMSLQYWLSHRSMRYNRDLRIQRKLSKQFRGGFEEVIQHNIKVNRSDQLCVPYSWHVDLPFPWFIWKAIWTCPFEERIGDIFDGGKWVCNVQRLRRNAHNCTIYSFGHGSKIGFETELSTRTFCTIHIFDPTYTRDAPSLSSLPPRTFFHPWGLGRETGVVKVGNKLLPLKSLGDTMKILGNEHLQLLKIDIDGGEWDVFRTLDLAHVDELLLELHWKGLELTSELFDHVQQQGLRIFHQEPNLFYFEQPAAGIEYSFVKKEMTL